jgi:hypothetical protein
LLAKVAVLFRELFKKCKNGVLPNLKLSQCIKKMHLHEPLYFKAKEPVEVYGPMMGGMLRCVASAFREIASDHAKRRVCFSKVFKIVLAPQIDRVNVCVMHCLLGICMF